MKAIKLIVGIGGAILLIIGGGVLYSRNKGRNTQYKAEPDEKDERIDIPPREPVLDEKDPVRKAALEEIIEGSESGLFDKMKAIEDRDEPSLPEGGEEEIDDDEEFEAVDYEDIPDDEPDDYASPPYRISEDELGEFSAWGVPIYYYYFRDDDTLVEMEQWTVESGPDRDKMLGRFTKYFQDDSIVEMMAEQAKE